MKGIEIYKLALLAVAETVIFIGGVVLIVNDNMLTGVILIVVGTTVTSGLIAFLVLKSRRSNADQGGQ